MVNFHCESVGKSARPTSAIVAGQYCLSFLTVRHCVGLVDCVCHVTSLPKSSTELQARLEQFRNDSEDCEKYCLSHDNESDDVCDSFDSVHSVSFVVCVCHVHSITSQLAKYNRKSFPIRHFINIKKLSHY